ncbi:VOC family protein [Lysinibacillus sp. NPDC048646]|uniref:VOC family protein n=1 Tax=Lysinibacillus sp. NPDC048646 TaxID=3390574 RepID=UPI003D07EC8B
MHIEEHKDLPVGRAGRGSVHHVAFRAKTVEEYEQWSDKLRALDFQTSGEVDLFYFRSIYFREPNGILYGLATDEPGFTSDEPLETLGKPPFSQGKRVRIERSLSL